MSCHGTLRLIIGLAPSVLLLSACGRAVVKPTPTVLPTSTPQPTATPDAAREQARAFAEPILKAIADREPDFEDDFSTADKGWQATDYDGQGGDSVSFENAQLRILVGKPRELTHVVNSAVRFNSFVLAVDAAAQGPSGSAYSPQVIWGPHTFVLWVHRNAWEARPCHSQGCDPNDADGYDKAISPGKTVRMMVVVQGNEFALYLDGKPLTYVNDPSRLSEGSIALAAYSNSPRQSTLITYDNLKVWDISKLP